MKHSGNTIEIHRAKGSVKYFQRSSPAVAGITTYLTEPIFIIKLRYDFLAIVNPLCSAQNARKLVR